MSKSRSKHRTLEDAFTAHTLPMLRSPARRALPANARLVLERLEVEHLERGGAENGSLICTYDDFERAGIRRPSVALSIRQCVALGFVVITRQGRRSISDVRQPSLYRLTYLTGRGKSPPPTHEWQQVKDEEDAAKRLASAQRRPKKQKAGYENVPHPPKSRVRKRTSLSTYPSQGIPPYSPSPPYSPDPDPPGPFSDPVPDPPPNGQASEGQAQGNGHKPRPPLPAWLVRV
jgi:hypothetical protein